MEGAAPGLASWPMAGPGSGAPDGPAGGGAPIVAPTKTAAPPGAAAGGAGAATRSARAPAAVPDGPGAPLPPPSAPSPPGSASSFASSLSASPSPSASSGPSASSSSEGSALTVKRGWPAARMGARIACCTAGGTGLLTTKPAWALSLPPLTDTRPKRKEARSSTRPAALASPSSLRGLLRRCSRITACRSLVRPTTQDAGLRPDRFSAARRSAGGMRPGGSSSPPSFAAMPTAPAHDAAPTLPAAGPDRKERDNEVLHGNSAELPPWEIRAMSAESSGTVPKRLRRAGGRGAWWGNVRLRR